jgi:hypothetical protein
LTRENFAGAGKLIDVQEPVQVHFVLLCDGKRAVSGLDAVDTVTAAGGGFCCATLVAAGKLENLTGIELGGAKIVDFLNFVGGCTVAFGDVSEVVATYHLVGLCRRHLGA